MKRTFLLVTTALAVSACASIVDEQTTRATLQTGFNAGESYTIRTRTMQGPQGQYEQTSVVYRGISAVCRRDSPNDCELAARNLIDGYSFGGLRGDF